MWHVSCCKDGLDFEIPFLNLPSFCIASIHHNYDYDMYNYVYNFWIVKTYTSGCG